MFEVKKDGKVMQYGPLLCLPDAERRRQLRAAGYKIYVDGRLYKE